ncbi:thiol-disulfide oxidoreductase DCC family protein [Neomegalonema sp.]|uniref:thiol-disulfide oxidoreductase DCC family protein n=1 Tax=Neomegalonema sp. TaxID=2039713 RepID=UPI0026164253|nr:DCC1-like thiol-disulfide oxidoreductase family protein [Neomegalonema sp.]MDD2869399.1 DCC1-like thiol-disulfide oxidoreductase family protein [Neomegalonema sp.]
MTSSSPPVLLFDTRCVLCSGATRFLLRHERDQDLRFAGAWSAEGRRLAEAHGLRPEDLDRTILVIEDGRALTKSAAVLALARRLKGPWRQAASLARLLPLPLRDRLYDRVAARRYVWFGRLDSCFLPAPEQRARFLGLEGEPPARA